MSNEYKSELSPSEDIVKWLRDERYDVCDRNMRCNGEVMEEAADEIERLRQQNAELVEALWMMLENYQNLKKSLKKLFEDFRIKTRVTIDKATGGE